MLTSRAFTPRTVLIMVGLLVSMLPAVVVASPFLRKKMGGPKSNPRNLETPCLCIFDIDRTLTGKQSDTKDCPNNDVQQGIWDPAYDPGFLTLSPLTQFINQTFCQSCYVGTISAGTADGAGSDERADLYAHLRQVLASWKMYTDDWSKSGCNDVTSPLVTSCNDGSKQNAVPKIVALYEKHENITIAKENVHFFDDRESNIKPFEGTGYNAHQISCDKRDRNGAIGLCGAQLKEITQDKGVALCPLTCSTAHWGSCTPSPNTGSCQDHVDWAIQHEDLTCQKAMAKVANQCSACSVCNASSCQP